MTLEESIARVRDWDDLIVQQSKLAMVPPSITAALMLQESGGNQMACSDMNYNAAGQPIGMAMGLMQVMPFHFAMTEDPYDPVTNLRVALQLLRSIYDKWQDWSKAAVGYFGALTGNGEISEAADVNGVTGVQYVALFEAGRQHFLDLDSPPLTDDQRQILGALDTMWGITKELEKAAGQIRDYIIVVKRAAGLEG